MASPLTETLLPRHYSLRISLLWLVTVCVVPVTLVAIGLGYANYRLQHDQVYRDTVLLARKLVADVDRELAAVESGLRVLATSPFLDEGDLGSFHKRARDALTHQIVNNYVLTDREGHQLLNTLIAWGQALPAMVTPPQLRRVVEKGTPVLSDLYIGPVTGAPIIALGVPVFRGDAVIYSLNVGLAADRVETILNHQKLPDGWIAAVIDGSGTIVARSRDGKKFVGQKLASSYLQRLDAEAESTFETMSKDNIHVVTSFSHSSVYSWSVAVGAPKAILDAALYRTMGWVVAVTVLSLSLGVWLAIRLARRVTSSVRGLNDAALALGRGEPVALPHTQLKEADAVGEAIVQASQILSHVRHLAHHDALTGLCNRVLFEELLQRHIASAQRTQSFFAVLAIDLDGFKAVNDLHGHGVGDQVLKAAAERIATTIRASDVAARLGGDEFAVLLGDITAGSAKEMADRLVLRLAEPYLNVIPKVSASLGISMYPQSGAAGALLMERADQALYLAKKSGRHCAVMDLAAASGA